MAADLPLPKKMDDPMTQRPIDRASHQQAASSELTQRVLALERQNKRLEQFAYVAAHELQEPLRKVTSFCQLLSQEYGGQLDPRGRGYLEHAADASVRMGQLVKELLAVAQLRSEDGMLSPTDAGKACDAAVGQLQAAIDESAAVVTRGPLPVIKAQPARLVQLFQNLIGNAIKYRSQPAPIVRVEARAVSEQWVFSVRDNGIGIETQYHQRVFGMFQRLHARHEYPGTGIGLAFCRDIVDHCGGRIWVESEPGRGSQFLFTFPRLKRRSQSDQRT